jgi:hypothetical protein
MRAVALLVGSWLVPVAARVALLAGALVGGAACAPAGGTEQLSVVVEAERTRALADQARLAEMQAALAAAKEELEATRTDLTALREKLMQTGALTAEEARRLEARERRLAEQERALAAPAATASALPSSGLPSSGLPSPALPSSGGASGVSRAELEMLLKEQEERLRLAFAGPPSAPAASAPAADLSHEVAAVMAAVRDVRARRALRADDIEGGAALERRIEAALRGRSAEALLAARELLQKTEAVVVNAGFIKRKYDRAQGRLGALEGESLARAKAALGEANAKNARGDHEGANRALNGVLDL